MYVVVSADTREYTIKPVFNVERAETEAEALKMVWAKAQYDVDVMMFADEVHYAGNVVDPNTFKEMELPDALPSSITITSENGVIQYSAYKV